MTAKRKPSNDRVPTREMHLARALADIALLWEPGWSRSLQERAAIDYYAEMS